MKNMSFGEKKLKTGSALEIAGNFTAGSHFKERGWSAYVRE